MVWSLQFIKKLVNTTCLQRYGVSLEHWQISLIWSFTLSIFCIGGLLGSLVVSTLLSKFGRSVFTNRKHPNWISIATLKRNNLLWVCVTCVLNNSLRLYDWSLSLSLTERNVFYLTIFWLYLHLCWCSSAKEPCPLRWSWWDDFSMG